MNTLRALQSVRIVDHVSDPVPLTQLRDLHDPEELLRPRIITLPERQ